MIKFLNINIRIFLFFVVIILVKLNVFNKVGYVIVVYVIKFFFIGGIDKMMQGEYILLCNVYYLLIGV